VINDKSQGSVAQCLRRGGFSLLLYYIFTTEFSFKEF